MNKYLLYLFLVCGVVFQVSCKKEKLKAAKSAFLVVNKAAVTTSVSSQGSNNITDIWLYVNQEFQGVFPVGKVMPVRYTGNADIMMYGGIKNNGISATRQPYPFYKAVTFSQIFEAGTTYTYNPTFEYLPSVTVKIFEDFDGTGGTNFIPGTNSTDSVYGYSTNPAQVYGGTGRSVFMSMSDAKPTSMIRTNNNLMNLPLGGAAIYMELDYKCNQEFIVGIIGGSSDMRDVLTINSSDNWNKIYIKLTDAISTPPNYIYYNVYIKATKQTGTPQIYLDNIKILYE